MSPEKFIKDCFHVSQIKQAIIFTDKLIRENNTDGRWCSTEEFVDDACRMTDLSEEMKEVVLLLIRADKNAALEWANKNRI